MLENGQKYTKDGIIYEVKEFEIIGSLIRLQLINTTNKQPLAVNTTISNFLSRYSKIPEFITQLTSY